MAKWVNCLNTSPAHPSISWTLEKKWAAEVFLSKFAPALTLEQTTTGWKLQKDFPWKNQSRSRAAAMLLWYNFELRFWYWMNGRWLLKKVVVSIIAKKRKLSWIKCALRVWNIVQWISLYWCTAKPFSSWYLTFLKVTSMKVYNAFNLIKHSFPLFLAKLKLFSSYNHCTKYTGKFWQIQGNSRRWFLIESGRRTGAQSWRLEIVLFDILPQEGPWIVFAPKKWPTELIYWFWMDTSWRIGA